MTKKIGFFVGSLRKDSYNKKVAEAFAKLLPEGYESVFVKIDGLPFYTEDLGSRPYGHSVWDNKPGLVVTASPGGIGGFGANHHLRQSLVFLNVPTLQQPEAYIGNIANLVDENGNVVEGTLNFFQTILDAYLAFANKLAD